MSDTARPKSAGDKLSADEVNEDLPIPMTAGETINGATLPVPIYIADSDGEVYACDANVSSKLSFIGFAISNGTDGNGITVQPKGVVGGFTGLDAGKEYFIQDAVGTIGASPGTNTISVGFAISATEILIINKLRIMTGRVARASGTGTEVISGLGGRPKMIKITAQAYSNGYTGWSTGHATSTSNEECVHWYSTDVNRAGGADSEISTVDTTHIIMCLNKDNGDLQVSATLSAIGNDGFTLNFDVFTGGAMNFIYEVWI